MTPYRKFRLKCSKARFPSVIVAAPMVAALVGCASTRSSSSSNATQTPSAPSVDMVRLQSGERVACPAGIKQHLTGVSTDQIFKLNEWSGYLRMREDRDPTLLEYCVKQYELFFGYVRAADDLVYRNPVYKWTVSYSRDWVLNSQDVGLVKLEPPPTLPWGRLGVRSVDAGSRSLEEFAEAYLNYWNSGMQRQGSSARVLSQQRRQLVDGTPTVEIVHRLGTGRMGQSRKLITVRDGRGLVIDAEAFLEDWPVLAPYFD